VLGRELSVPFLLLLPVAGLLLLFARPELDVMYQHDPTHFWIVLLAALLNVALGLLTSEIARRQGDVRLFLVSMALLTGAAFLGLHALATPAVLVPGSNTGFVVANPVGLLLASVFAALSAVGRGRWMARPLPQGLIKAALGAVVLAWGVVSLTGLPPLGKSVPSQQLPEGLQLLGIPALALYGFAAVRYGLLFRRRHRGLLLAVAAAYVLLAEAMIAVVFSATWHAAWWEWHVLLVAAFATIAIGARAEYRHARSLPGAFGGLYLDSTLDRIDRRRAAALSSLVAALRAGEPLSPILPRPGTTGPRRRRSRCSRGPRISCTRPTRCSAPTCRRSSPPGWRRTPNWPCSAARSARSACCSRTWPGSPRSPSGAGRRGHRDAEPVLGATVPIVGEREGGVIERFAATRSWSSSTRCRTSPTTRCAPPGPRSACATRSCS
jgi:hypothetical protein